MSIRLLAACTLLCVQGALAHSGADHAHPDEAARIPTIADVNPWTHLQFQNDPEAFQFAIVTDRTGGLRPGVFSQAVDNLNLLQPEFVVSVGDLIEGYTEDRAQLTTEWNEFDDMVQRLDMPFFYLAGNHDYTNEVMADIWRERYGKSYYHFLYRDVLFVMLNSNDGGKPHTFSGEQIDWLKGVLKDNPSPRWTLVFTHSPLWDRPDANRWGEIEALLQQRHHTVFAGHHHRYVKARRQGNNYFTLATTGGISSMRGARFGEFDHLVWVTMSEEGPIIANLMLDGIRDENIRTQAMRERQNKMIDEGRVATPALMYRDSFKAGEAQLRLTNDADRPYDFTARFAGVNAMAVAGERLVNITVPPNEVVKVPVPVRAAETVTDDREAVTVDWTLRYQLEGEPIEYEGERTIAVSRERPIAVIESVELDGKLDEWDLSGFIPAADHRYFQTDNWKGPQDAGFHWQVAASGDYLVLAVDVIDDAIVRQKAKQVLSQDSLLVTLDARARNRRQMKQTYDNRIPGDRTMVLQPTAPERPSRMLGRPKVPDSVLYKVRPHDSGYTAEIAIPFTLLDEDHGSRWDGVRLNVLLRDADPREPGVVGMEWLSSWGHESSLGGAGSFYRVE